MKEAINQLIVDTSKSRWGGHKLGQRIAAVQALLHQARVSHNAQQIEELTDARIELQSHLKRKCPGSGRYICLKCPISDLVEGNRWNLTITEDQIKGLENSLSKSGKCRRGLSVHII